MSNKNQARLGVVVTKKTGKAVRRNAWKRMVREMFRVNKNSYAAKDYVLVVKPSTQAWPQQEDRVELKKIFDKAGKKS